MSKKGVVRAMSVHESSVNFQNLIRDLAVPGDARYVRAVGDRVHRAGRRRVGQGGAHRTDGLRSPVQRRRSGRPDDSYPRRLTQAWEYSTIIQHSMVTNHRIMPDHFSLIKCH